MSERDGGGGGFLTGLFLGAGIGAAVGLLLAPKSGQETLEELRMKSDEIKAKGKSLLDEEGGLREVVEEVREILKEAVDEGREVLKEAVEEGKMAAAKASEELQAKFDAAREGRSTQS